MLLQFFLVSLTLFLPDICLSQTIDLTPITIKKALSAYVAKDTNIQQNPYFQKQLVLAEKYQKPVVIHCVAAFHEVIEIKKKLNISVPMIIHGFSKNEQVAKSLLDNGFYLSFGKYLLRSRPETSGFGTELKDVFLNIPNDRFFLETDTIEESIEEVYALAAKYKNIEIEELQKQIMSNYKDVFKVFERE